MKTSTITLFVVGILIGVGGTVLATRGDDTSVPKAVVTIPSAADGMPGMDMPASSMSMDDMESGLKGLSGSEFDKKFLSEMIVHHQSAIDMATLAQEQAGHDEVKKLADSIIAAQNGEIAQMQQWQKDWGY